MKPNWYYSRGDGITHGPVEWQELTLAIRECEIQPDDFVLQESLSEWTSVQAFKTLKVGSSGQAISQEGTVKSIAVPKKPPVRTVNEKLIAGKKALAALAALLHLAKELFIPALTILSRYTVRNSEEEAKCYTAAILIPCVKIFEYRGEQTTEPLFFEKQSES